MEGLDVEAPVVRDLTEEEIRQFHETGWVFVKGYVRRDIATKMLEIGKKRMGTADGALFDKEKVTSVKNWWWEVSNIAREDDLFAKVGLAPSMGHNIQRLFRRNVGIHYLSDALMAKAPAHRTDGSLPTIWHQDIPSFPFDRSGTMACWMALDHLTPDMGTMHFLEGSHKGEYYGRFPDDAGPDEIFEVHPELKKLYRDVPSPTFEPGDVTFHHCQTVHGAPANAGDRARWSYVVAFMASDCRYTGASCVYTDGMQLPVDEPIRHPRFPLIWSAAR
jgi:hypothetical protein